VPEGSSSYVHARVAEVELLLRAESPTSVADAVMAASIVESTELERQPRDGLRAAVLESLLHAACNGQLQAADGLTVFGRLITEKELRLGLEETYRDLARGAGSGRERIAFVDRANRVRPRSWL